MVVRSNGCFACKRRKIKCDQLRPHCRRCVVHRIQCPGYASDSDNPVNIVMYGTSPESDSSQSSNIPLQINTAVQKRIQLVMSAASKLVPMGESPAVPLDLLDIAGFNAVHIRQPALEAAIDALALAQLGTSSKDMAMLASAQRAYGRSLRLLNTYITNTFKVWDEQMASAIVLLKYCESFKSLHHANNGGTFGSVHHIGLRSFLLSRGPVPLRDSAESIVFCQARVIVVGGSFTKRQRCFLEDPEWIEVSRNAPGRDEFYELEDIISRLPGLAERADSSITVADEQAQCGVIKSIREFIQDLDRFATYCWPSEFATTDAYETVTWLSTSKPYSFDNWRLTNVFCTWSMVRLFALLEIQRLHAHSNSISLPCCQTRIWRQTELAAEIEQCTNYVYRSIPAQIGLQPSALNIITSLMMLPKTASLLQSQGRTMEAEWCNTTLEEMRMQGYR